MKYTATIDQAKDGSVTIAIAVKTTKDDLTKMIAACSLPEELSIKNLRDVYERGPASRFIQSVAQFVFWGELR